MQQLVQQLDGSLPPILRSILSFKVGLWIRWRE
jgi:hypothetical protein